MYALILPLLINILVIGNNHDLRQAGRLHNELDMPVLVHTIRDNSARSRFLRYQPIMVRALWSARYSKLYAKRNISFDPKVIVVFGNTNISGNWSPVGVLGPPSLGKDGCINGETVTCRADDIPGCVLVIEGTWCR